MPGVEGNEVGRDGQGSLSKPYMEPSEIHNAFLYMYRLYRIIRTNQRTGPRTL